MRWLFKNLREVGKASNIIITQNFKRVDFGLFKELVGRISLGVCPEGQRDP